MKHNNILILIILLLSVVSSTVFADEINYLNLEAYYSGDGTDYWNDVATTNHNATVLNGVTFNISGGKFGDSANFDGDTDYIYIPHDNSLSFQDKDYSISVWVRAESYGATKYVYSSRNAATSDWFYIQFLSTNKYRFVADDGSNPLTDLSSAATYADNQWHLITVTRDTSENRWTLYVDDATGVTTTGGADSSVDITEGFYIGSDWNPNSGWWHGQIDEMGFWNVTLNSAQVSELYSASKNPLPIGNYAPTLSSYNISNQTPQAIDYLDCSFIPQDADNDSVNVSITWYKNDVNIGTYDYTFIDDTLNVESTTGAATGRVTETLVKDDVWICSFTITDGTETASYNTSSVTVLNTDPVISEASISPLTPLSSENLTGVCTSSDVDNDLLIQNYTWYIDNTPTQIMWNNNNTLNLGFPDFINHASPTVFFQNGIYKAIIGNLDGNMFGYQWNGSTWISNTSIVSGLSSVSRSAAPEAFYDADGELSLIVGASAGTFIGYQWTGSTWVSNSTKVAGIGDIGIESVGTIFNNGQTLITGERENGALTGFQWNGTGWALNSSIISGIPASLGIYSTPTAIKFRNITYLIVTVGSNILSYKNNGSAWSSDSFMQNTLSGFDYQSRITIFNDSKKFHAIVGKGDGTMISFSEQHDILHDSLISTGNEIILQCSASDGDTVSYLNSSATTILNTPLIMTEASVLPLFPISNQQLTGNCTSTDYDNDIIQYTYTWFINDIDSGAPNLTTLAASYISPSDEVILQCTGSDGANISVLNSSIINVSNGQITYNDITHQDITGDTSYYFGEYLDYINIDLYDVEDSNNSLTPYITVYDPEGVIVVNNQSTSYVTGTIHRYSTDIYLNAIGDWNITVITTDSDGDSASYSETFSVGVVTKTIDSNIYGWNYNSVPVTNETIEYDIANYAFKYIEMEIDGTETSQEWNDTISRADAIKDSNALAIITIRANLDTSDAKTFVTNNYADLISHGPSIYMLKIEVIGNPTNTTLRDTTLNDLMKEILQKTNNTYPVRFRNYDTDGFNVNYGQLSDFVYINESNNGDQITQEVERLRLVKLNRIYEGDSNKTFASDFNSNVIANLRSSVKIPTYANEKVVELTNYDIIVFNNQSSQQTIPITLSSNVTGTDVYDITKHSIIELDTDGSVEIIVDANTANIIYFEELSKIVVDESDIFSLYSSQLGNITTSESYIDTNKGSWTYSESQTNNHYDGMIILNDPNYLNMNFYTYYGGIREHGVDNLSIYDIFIFGDDDEDSCNANYIASCSTYNSDYASCVTAYTTISGKDRNCVMPDQWGTAVCEPRTLDLGSAISGQTGICGDNIYDDSGAITDVVLASDSDPYGYMAVDDYCNPSSWDENDRQAWLVSKKSKIDSWTNIDLSLNIFLDGYDIGDSASCDNQTIEDLFVESVQEIADYVRITKNRKLIFNTYTQYQDVVHMADGIMKESCVGRWSGTTDNPVYAWEDWSVEMNRYNYFNSFGVDVFCQGFAAQSDYESAYYIFLAAKVLGYEYISVNQPKFWYAWYNGADDNWNNFKFPNVGFSLDGDMTDEGDGIYSRRYENGLIRINTTSHTGEFITDEAISSMELCVTLKDTDDTKEGSTRFVFNDGWEDSVGKTAIIDDSEIVNDASFHEVCTFLDEDIFYEESGYYNIKFFYVCPGGSCLAMSQSEILTSYGPLNGGRRSSLDDGSAADEDHTNSSGNGYQPDLDESTYLFRSSTWTTNFDTRASQTALPNWKNYDIELKINRTTSRLVDTIPDTIVTRSETSGTLKTINMISSNLYDLPLYDKLVYHNKTIFNGIFVGDTALNYNSSMECITTNPAYENTTIDGDLWQACYYNPVSEDGYYVKVVLPNLSINNYIVDGAYPPVISNYNITNQTPKALDYLDCEYVPSNGDSIEVNISVTWYKNDINVPTYDYTFTNDTLDILTTTGSGTGRVTETLTKDDVWICSLEITDGTETVNYNTSSVTVLNSEPTIINATILPATPYSYDNLTGICNASDDDSDILSYNYTWYINATIVPAYSEQILTEDYTITGNEVILQCSADDGTNITYLNSSMVTILQPVPLILSSEILPSGAVSNDTLIANCTGFVYDGGNLTYNYSWYVNNVYTGINNANLLNTEFDRFDNVILECSVTAENETSAPLNSTTIIIGNTIPSVDTVSISGVYAGNQLNGSCSASDYENDTLIYSYEWYINNNSTGIPTTQNLSGDSFFIDDEVILSCRVNDGYNNSLWKNSSITTILNQGVENFTFLTDDINITIEVGDTITIEGTVETYANLSNCTVYLQAGNDTSPYISYPMTVEPFTTSNIDISFTLLDYFYLDARNVTYWVTCYDITGNFENSTNVTFTTYDLTNPIITLDSETQSYFNNNTVLDGIYNTELNLNITFADSFLFQTLVNVTCDDAGDLFVDNQVALTSETYNFVGSISVEGLPYQRCQIILSSSDSHTTTEIPEYDVEVLDNSIKYLTENNANIEITSNDITSDVNSEKYIDRYNFEFAYSDNALLRSYTIKSDKEIFFIEWSNYPAHFVVWNYNTNTGNWIDFALDNSDEFTYIVNKISNYEYDVFIVHNSIVPDILEYEYFENETHYENISTNESQKVFNEKSSKEKGRQGIKIKSEITEEQQTKEVEVIKKVKKYKSININKKETYKINKKPNIIMNLFNDEIIKVSKSNKPNILEIKESKITKNELKQLLKLEEGDVKYGIKFVRFNSVGGTNIINSSAIFYIGGVINITSNNINTGATIDEYNLSMISSFNTSQYVYNTSENKIENLAEDVYTLVFTSEEFVPQTYVINLTTLYDNCTQYLPNETTCTNTFNSGNISYTSGDFNNPENMFDKNISSYADVVSLDYTNIYLNYTVPDNASKVIVSLYMNETEQVNITFNVSYRETLSLNISVRQGSDSDDILIQEIIHTPNGWNSNTNIINGLTLGIAGNTDYSYLKYENENYLIHSSILGYLVAYKWNGTEWEQLSGSKYVATYLKNTAFEYNNTQYILTGELSGAFKGYIFNGTNFTSDTSIINGIASNGGLSSPEVFKYRNEIYLIYENTPIGLDPYMSGFKWNGTGWSTYSAIINGLVSPNGNSDLAVFKYNGQLYAIVNSYIGGTTSFNFAYIWNGYKWTKVSSMYDDLRTDSSHLSPEAFEINNTQYLIQSYDNLRIYGYEINLTSILNNISYSPITNYNSKFAEQQVEWLMQEPNIEYVTYNSSNAEITFKYTNVKTDDFIDDFILYINSTENSTLIQYNSTDTSITLPFKAGIEYTVLFEKEGFLNTSFSYTFDYLDQYTIIEDIAYTLNVNIIDEDTLDPFEFNGVDKLEILVICDDESFKYEINESNTTIPVNCAYDRIKAAVDYNVSVSADYYRIYIGDYEENDTLTIYLIDVLDTDYIYTNFILDDLLAKYQNPSIWVKKKAENETAVIHSDYTDIENKISTFLIKNDEYIIEVHSDNLPIQIIGRYGADYGQEKVISLYDVNLQVDPDDFYENIYYTMNIINDSGNKSIQFSYEDLTNDTASVQFRVYADRLGGTLVYESEVYSNTSSILSLLYETGIYENTTLIPEIEIIHNIYEDKNVSKIVNKNWLLNDVPDTVGAEFLSWFLLLFLSVVAIFSAYNTNWASVALVGVAALFVVFNWLTIGMGVLVIALLVALLDMFFKRGKK